jgi:hypothetical protein
VVPLISHSELVTRTWFRCAPHGTHQAAFPLSVAWARERRLSLVKIRSLDGSGVSSERRVDNTTVGAAPRSSLLPDGAADAPVHMEPLLGALRPCVHPALPIVSAG